MAGDVVNIKFCSPLKLHSGLTGKCHAFCHYSCSLSLRTIKMTKIRVLILISLISYSVFSQELKPTQQDVETYIKLESGGFSNDFYLRAIIEEKISDSSVVELQKKFGDGMKEMYCTGLIKSLINKNHGGRYINSHYFSSLQFEKFKGKSYFYESASLHGDKELFIWGTYGRNDSDISIHSAVGHNLELMAYTSVFKTISNSDFIIFDADEQVAIIPIEGDTAFTLSYDVSEFEKIGTYRKCVLVCDTCIECKRLQHIGKSDQVEIQQRVFTTELLIEDIDDNGTFELYWFAVSSGELIKHEAYTFSGGVLITLKKDIKKLIIETSRFEEMRKISMLEQKPKL